MKKDELLKILDFASFMLIIIATLLVIVFEFVGSYAVMKCAIVIYFIGLLVLTIFLSFRVYFAFKKIAEPKEGENTPDIANKKQKIINIVMLVVSAIAMVFTFVVMILY